MSILDDLLGRSSADASNAAAADTYGKITRAGNDLRAYGDQYASDFKNLSGSYQPYVTAGSDALKRLLSGLGLSGGDGSDFTAAYHALPGYQSGLDTGTNAAISAANAGGMLNSGKALKSLQRFGSNYEDQRSGDYLTRLMGLQGQGLQATGAQIGTQMQGLNGQLGTRQSAYGGDVSGAPVIGQGMVAGEQAKQGALTNIMNTAGYLGGAALGGGMPRVSSFGGTNQGAPGGGYYGTGNTLYPGPGRY